MDPIAVHIKPLLSVKYAQCTLNNENDYNYVMKLMWVVGYLLL